MNEITITELAKESGLTVTHVGQLVLRGILPQGRKEGKHRYLPYQQSMTILGMHVRGTPWTKVNTPKITQEPKKKTWADLL